MSDICSKTADDSFDFIMENSCPTTFVKCQWIVKDFTKYPENEIESPSFEPSGMGSLQFVLLNFTSDKVGLCPSLKVKFYCYPRYVYVTFDKVGLCPSLKVKFYCYPRYVYVTFNISFSDSNGEVFYEIKKTLEFSPPNQYDLMAKDFPLGKILEMPEDTVIIKCEMKISRPKSALLTSNDTEI